MKTDPYINTDTYIRTDTLSLYKFNVMVISN